MHNLKTLIWNFIKSNLLITKPKESAPFSAQAHELELVGFHHFKPCKNS